MDDFFLIFRENLDELDIPFGSPWIEAEKVITTYNDLYSETVIVIIIIIIII